MEQTKTYYYNKNIIPATGDVSREPCSKVGAVLSATFGNFSNPKYDTKDPGPQTCKWRITVPESVSRGLNVIQDVLQPDGE